MMGGVDYHGAMGMASTGVIKDDKIVLSRETPAVRQHYRLRLCEQWDRIGYAYAALRAQNLRPGDDVALDLNGVPVPDNTVRRMWHKNGRSTNIGRPLPAYSTVIFDLNPNVMIDGDNTLGVTLTNQEEEASGNILIDEIDVPSCPEGAFGSDHVHRTACRRPRDRFNHPPSLPRSTGERYREGVPQVLKTCQRADQHIPSPLTGEGWGEGDGPYRRRDTEGRRKRLPEDLPKRLS